MGWSTGQLRNAAQTRLEILSGAVALAKRERLAALTFRSVARAASRPLGTVQTHFRSIDDLHAEVVLQIGDALAGSGGVKEQRGLARVWALATSSYRELDSVRIVLDALLEPDDRRCHAAAVSAAERWRERVMTALQTAEAAGELMPGVDVRGLALAIHAVAWAQPWGAPMLGISPFAISAGTALWNILAAAAAPSSSALGTLEQRLQELRRDHPEAGAPVELPFPPGSFEWEDVDSEEGRRLQVFDVLFDVDDPARETFERMYGMPIGSSGPKAAARRARAVERYIRERTTGRSSG